MARRNVYELGQLLEPGEAEEPILARPVRNALLEWLTEIWAENELQAVGLAARRRALFSGAPGTGKTTLAHHLSARLGLPMVIVRPDDVHGQYVGTGISNIKRIFDAAEAHGGDAPIVLFFDEFETAAQKRMHTGVNPTIEHDHNAMVNALLARLEAYPSFVIAATNQADSIDPAVWRRFDIHIALDIPGQFERERILARYLAPYGLPKRELAQLAEAMETASPALMRGFCEGLKRQIIVGPKVGWDMRRDATVERQIASLEPHPDLGRPRLWSHGTADAAIKGMTWPLAMAVDIQAEPEPAAEPAAADVVVPLHRGRNGGG